MRIFRRDVGDNGNHAEAAERHQRHDHIVVAGIEREIRRHEPGDFRDLRDVAARFFHAADVAMFRQFRHRFRRKVHARAPWHVIHNNRNMHGVGNRDKIRHQPFLRRFIVIRRNAQQRVRADVFSMDAHLHRVGRIVAAAASDHRDALFRHFDSAFNHPFMFLIGQRRRFAGCAARDDRVRPFLNLPLDQFREFVEIDGIVLRKWRDNRHA